MKRILIANRGEIAVRIIRAVRELGLESVAVYSDADAQSQHRFLADYAINLPGITSAQTYLDIEVLVKAIQTSGADAVHPGYGFLSESDVFAKAVTDAGAKYIGPSVQSMQMMGNKIRARELMAQHKVPTVPGSKEPLKTETDLKKLVDEIGYPVIIKAAAGGGGRGMRVVRKDSELKASLESCQREAISYFGNGDVFCERFIENPRHIEIQVLFDEQGNGVHLFERDCSIQRRHQKPIEEAPSKFLNAAQRAKLGEVAVTAAKAAKYWGAGTVEFICESTEKIYFMEMNTRIQVEHCVTEMISGIDIVKWQIKVAAGESLNFKQEELRVNGWAIEARINAEDVRKDFMPCPGKLGKVVLPSGPFVRVDTHIKSGYTIPDTYDSMIAKVIAWGRTREEAIACLLRALSELETENVVTTAEFHEAVLQNAKFISGNFTTKFLEEELDTIKEFLGATKAETSNNLALAALIDTVAKNTNATPTQEASRSQWNKRAIEEGVMHQ